MRVLAEESNKANGFSRFWRYSYIAVFTKEHTDEKGIPEDSICHNPVIDFLSVISFWNVKQNFTCNGFILSLL